MIMKKWFVSKKKKKQKRERPRTESDPKFSNKEYGWGNKNGRQKGAEGVEIETFRPWVLAIIKTP